MLREGVLGIAVIVLLFAVVSNADTEVTTQQAVLLADDSSVINSTNNSTTLAPKIKISDNKLCKKCSCIFETDFNQIDCSNRSMNIFTTEEWKILEKGDVTFTIIKLEHNNIAKVPKLPSYPTKSLYLGFNQIVNIEMGAFHNFSELEKLDLSHNNLTSKALQPDIFKGSFAPNDFLPLKNLRELDLGYNKLHHLDDDLFEHLPNLETLILCHNSFQVIDQHSVVAISGLLSLKTLDMSFMELRELPDNFLHGPRDLDTLILSGNLFEEVPVDLKLAINLRQLVLDENLIEDLSGDNVFPNLPQLRYLSLSYMPELKRVGEGAFANLQNLTTLILSSNPNLRHIHTKAFARNTTIEGIYAFPRLEKLYLHNNNLTRIVYEMLDRWDLVTTVDLRFNPWICDCDNRWLIHTLMNQINNTTPIIAADVLCFQPIAWNGIPLRDVAEKTLKCSPNETHNADGLFLVGLLVGLLVCIPIVLGSAALWRRGCFGLNRQVAGGNRALYNRADFSDDLHI